jgi:hypothetical protein
MFVSDMDVCMHVHVQLQIYVVTETWTCGHDDINHVKVKLYLCLSTTL